MLNLGLLCLRDTSEQGFRMTPVWPDLVKFCQYGTIFKLFWGVILVFGNNLKILWQILYALGQGKGQTVHSEADGINNSQHCIIKL